MRRTLPPAAPATRAAAPSCSAQGRGLEHYACTPYSQVLTLPCLRPPTPRAHRHWPWARSGSPRLSVSCCNNDGNEGKRLPPCRLHDYPSVRSNRYNSARRRASHVFALLTGSPLFSSRTTNIVTFAANLSGSHLTAPAFSCISATRRWHWPALPATLAGRRQRSRAQDRPELLPAVVAAKGIRRRVWSDTTAAPPGPARRIDAQRSGLLRYYFTSSCLSVSIRPPPRCPSLPSPSTAVKFHIRPLCCLARSGRCCPQANARPNG